MINVCFGLHDVDGKYSKFAGATMASIFENTAAPVTIHILHDATLTVDNRDKFSYIAGKYAQAVKFHNVEEICSDEIKFLREKLADKIKLRFSIGAFYRLLMKKILRAGKVIYLDADIIVNLDIAELWRQDMKNFPVAAVPEMQATFNRMIKNRFLLNSGRVKPEDYFCSGVMIFNLDAIGENFFREGVQFLADNPKCASPDQDILNAFFSTNYLKLEQKFDSFVLSERGKNPSATGKIYHYAGNCIEPDLSDEYNRLWLENFARTPWFNANVIGRFSEILRAEKQKNLSFVMLMMKISVQHRRAFVAEAKNIPALKSAFAVQDDEPIIEISGKTSLQELLTKMTELRGKKTAFLFHTNFDGLKKFLQDHGFKESRDFIDGRIFLASKKSSNVHEEYKFIKAL